MSQAIVTHLRGRLPPAASLSPADEKRLSSFVHYIPTRFYYPTNSHDLTAAANASIDSVESPDNPAVLVQAAIAGIVGSLGHGAALLTTLGEGGPGGASAGATPATRDIGSLRLVALPNMNVSNANTAHTCADLARYVAGRSSDGVTGFILDLRGNEGGSLTDSSCLASLFLKKGQALFQVLTKRGDLVKYESEPTGHDPISLPIAVLIDNHTDNAGLLIAAILQAHRRATVIGELKADINGAVSSLVFPPGFNAAIILPTGEILLPDKQPLASGVRIDVAVAGRDDNALLGAAQTWMAQQHR